MHEREERIRERIAEREAYAQTRACPIYGISGSKGQLVGSGFLLKVHDKTLLVTAAHVLDAKRESVLHVPGPGRLVPFEGQAYTTRDRDGSGPPNYRQDLAFIVLLPDSTAAIAGCEVLTGADLDVNDLPAPQTLYGFAGFPGSQNKPRPGRVFRRSSVIYTATPAPEGVYRKLRYDRRTHLAVNFDRQHVVTPSLQVATAPDPHGVSGGPVWRLGALSDIEAGVGKPMVVALAIEWWRPLKALVGLRMSLVVEGIRKVLPEAASLFPLNEHVKVNVNVNPGLRTA